MVKSLEEIVKLLVKDGRFAGEYEKCRDNYASLAQQSWFYVHGGFVTSIGKAPCWAPLRQGNVSSNCDAILFALNTKSALPEYDDNYPNIAKLIADILDPEVSPYRNSIVKANPPTAVKLDGKTYKVNTPEFVARYGYLVYNTDKTDANLLVSMLGFFRLHTEHTSKIEPYFEARKAGLPVVASHFYASRPMQKGRKHSVFGWGHAPFSSIQYNKAVNFSEADEYYYLQGDNKYLQFPIRKTRGHTGWTLPIIGDTGNLPEYYGQRVSIEQRRTTKFAEFADVGFDYKKLAEIEAQRKALEEQDMENPFGNFKKTWRVA